MNQLKGSLLRGGGDDMIALRCYPSDDGTVLCDLLAPASGNVYTKCPTLLGVTVPAPSTEWTGDGLSDRPVVFAVYRSSQGNSRKTPVVVGVLANSYLKYVSEKETEESTEDASSENPPKPGVKDSVLATGNSRLVLRDGGLAQLVAKAVAMTAGSLKFSDGASGEDYPVLATPIHTELVTLSEKVNGIINYLQSLVISTSTGPATATEPMLIPQYSPPQKADIHSRSVVLPGASDSTLGEDETELEEITDEPL